jgi:hypothetical protein
MVRTVTIPAILVRQGTAGWFCSRCGAPAFVLNILSTCECLKLFGSLPQLQVQNKWGHA